VACAIIEQVSRVIQVASTSGLPVPRESGPQLAPAW
jgi:hypothetical protein